MASTKVIKRNANVANLNSGIAEETLFFAGGDENEDFVMDISVENTSAILNELTDLSSNPGAYAIREAYSNAYDAVAATGDMSRPIEVTVPMNDEFSEESLAYKLHISECPLDLIRYTTVTDHGIGMTTDDLRRFFTQYGGTKKQGAGLIGSKGLGSKAPLSCADFFDVVTVKDGIRSAAHLWRGNGHNYAKIVKVEPTSQPDGTTVRIPIVDPKIATEMHECMTGIAKWNLDANLTYNGEKASTCLNDGISKDGMTGYVFLGNVTLGVDEDGNEVKVRMWQGIDTFPRRLWGRSGYGNGQMNWNMKVDLNLCGVRYSLTNGNGYSSKSVPDIIVAGDPGYLNFTPSRDEVKDDDAKSTFLEAISEVSYDVDAVIASLFDGNDYATVSKTLIEHDGYLRRGSDRTNLIISGERIGNVEDDGISVFGDVDMSDYLIMPSDYRLAPASGTRYRSITKMSGHGYVTPCRALAEDGTLDTHETAYIGSRHAHTAREIARGMQSVHPLPLAAIVPSVVMFSTNVRGGWNENRSTCINILNGGNNHVLLITGPTPAWAEFQNRESSIRRLVADKANQDMKLMALTYLFLDGNAEPTEQDKLALTMFAGSTITTWAELVAETRSMNRATKGGTQATSAKRSLHVGSFSTNAYELRYRRDSIDHPTPFADAMDALLGPATRSKQIQIDYDNDDLSNYVFAIGDGGTPDTVARIASAMAMAGLLGNATHLCFVSSTASCTTTYPLGMNEVKALVKSRGMKVLGDFRHNRAHFDGIIDGIDGITYEVKSNGNGYYHINSSIALETLGITEPTDDNLAYALRHGDVFRRIGTFIHNCRSILGTTFCDKLDAVLDARPRNWWEHPSVYGYRRSYGGSYDGIRLAFPAGWSQDIATLDAAVEAFRNLSLINGIQSIVSEASDEDGIMARAIVAPGLQSVIQGQMG